MIDTEILEEFASEARELLEEMEQSLIRLEKEGPEPELLNTIFRAAHCIKGSAEYIGLERSGAFTHGMENLLDRLREGRLKLTPGIIDFLFRAKDLIAALLEEVTRSRQEQSDISSMMRELDAYVKGVEPEAAADEELVEHIEEEIFDPDIPESEIEEMEVSAIEDDLEAEEAVVSDEMPPDADVDIETTLRADTDELKEFSDALDEIAEMRTITAELETPDDLAAIETGELTEEFRREYEVLEESGTPIPGSEPTLTEDEPEIPGREETTAEVTSGSPVEEMQAGTTLEETVPHVLNMSLFLDDLEDGLSFEDMRSSLLGTISNLRDSLGFLEIPDAVTVLEEMESVFLSCEKTDGRLSADSVAQLRTLLDDLQASYPPETFPREEPTLPEPEVTPTEEVSPVPIPFADELLRIPGTDARLIQAIYDAGFTSKEHLERTDTASLTQIPGMSRAIAEAVVKAFEPVLDVKKDVPRTPEGKRSMLADVDDELLKEFEGIFGEEEPPRPSPPPAEPLLVDGELAQQLGAKGEETDKEIIEIFISYAWEIVDRILPVAGKARDGSVERSDLESCADSIKSIRASSSYMDYRKLAAFLDDWYERTLWAADVVDTLTPEDLTFIDDKVTEFQELLRRLETSVKPALAEEEEPVPALVERETPTFEPPPGATELEPEPEITVPVESPRAQADFEPAELQDAVQTPPPPAPAPTEHPDRTVGPEPTGEIPESAPRPRETAPEAPVVRTMRVDAGKVDLLLNQVGELVVNRSYVEQLSLELRNFQRDLSSAAEVGKREVQTLKDIALRVGEASVSLGRAATDLQEGVMKLRMLPVGQLFNRMPRLIRDLSRRVGKTVELRVRGGDTEVDKRVIEQIYNPLVHLIRNAVDHGIEDPKTRRGLGKDEGGLILLNAYSQGNQVVIDIEDDGRGIDPEEVRNKAVGMGLIEARDASDLSAQEVHNFLFVPGFSTSKRVTRTSGRGVGMDVVKKDVEKINGQIEIDSVKGKGTRISIKIPLTLAIIQTLLIRFGSHVFAIPLTSVREIVQVAQQEFSAIEGFEVIKFRDQTIPVLRIDEVFRMSNSHKSGSEKFMVLATTGLKTFGFPVEELVGEQDVVIKPLAEHVWKTRGLAGSTILGDGTIALVLDVAELVEDVVLQHRQLAQLGSREPTASRREGAENRQGV
jgi:two-component system chemotaxis sensor kinase CheA